MTLYRYYCADTECGKHFCSRGINDMEAAYRADSIAKEWYKPPSRIMYLDKQCKPARSTDLMTKKYFPNQWNKIARCPAEWFESIEYDELMDWKMNGWVISPPYDIIIRTRHCETGKIKEYTYIRPDAAGRRLKKLLAGQEHELIVCTHDHIQHLKPEQYITDNDKENKYTK